VSGSRLLNVKRICGKTRPVDAGVEALRDEYTRSIEPARARATETSQLGRAFSDLVNLVCGPTPAEIDLIKGSRKAALVMKNQILGMEDKRNFGTAPFIFQRLRLDR